MEYDYFYGVESESFRFVQIPYAFFSLEEFKELTSDAKILYGLMLGMMNLSRKNGWFDDENRVYISWSQDDMASTLGRSVGTVSKTINQLKDAGLIQYDKHGQGNCAVIYLKDFLHCLEGNENKKIEKKKFLNRKKCVSRNSQVQTPDRSKIDANNINNIYKKNNNNKPSVDHRNMKSSIPGNHLSAKYDFVALEKYINEN